MYSNEIMHKGHKTRPKNCNIYTGLDNKALMVKNMSSYKGQGCKAKQVSEELKKGEVN